MHLRNILWIATLLILSTCCRYECYEVEGPALLSVNIIDRNGITETVTNPGRLCQFENVDFLSTQPYQKVMRIYNRDMCGDIYSYITSYYPNGQVKQYLEVVNGRACGAYKEWHSNGARKLEGNVIGGMADIVSGAEITWLFDGCCLVWNEQEVPIAEFNYCKGELDGPTTHYHCNGAIWKKAMYCKDLIEGPYEIYSENGELLQITNYCHGKRHGESLSYYCGNVLAAKEEYCEGLLVSGVYYGTDSSILDQIIQGTGERCIFENGALAGQQQFRNGKPEGLSKVFNKCGDVIRLFHEKDNVKHGEETLYFEQGLSRAPRQPKLSVTWFEGKIQGIVKTWYDNGVQESQRELSNNEKNGLSTAWYRDGSLMLIEEYEHDKLIKGDYFQKGDRFPVSQVADGTGTATLYDPEGTLIRKISYIKSKPEL